MAWKKILLDIAVMLGKSWWSKKQQEAKQAENTGKTAEKVV